MTVTATVKSEMDDEKTRRRVSQEDEMNSNNKLECNPDLLTSIVSSCLASERAS